ncbi:hypothetical protein, partial [Pontibacter sp. BAB1700]|uniref:capsular polysaccharide export protein, LipB/KpsS family n=1 Tax=Pontibacter sp. BAB1700 TaxID=1144253 RepID=UPI00026BD677
KTTIINNSFIPHIYTYIEEFEHGNPALTNKKEEFLGKGDLSRLTLDYVNRVSLSNSQSVPHYMKRQFNKRSSPWKRIINSKIQRLKNLKSILRGVKNNYLKVKLKEEYIRSTSGPNLEEDYIFVALHFQPERTTMPQGGIFAQQWLIIDMLSKTIPSGWKIYVKEHPSMFMIGPEPVRRHELYKILKKYSNVKLIDLDVDSFTLIKSSKAVATVTGTIGFESLIHGVPVLAFGFPSYMGLKGVFKISNLKELYFCSRSNCKRYNIRKRRFNKRFKAT